MIPEEVQKVYFTVGEAALILGVNCSCVRFWLIHFDLDKNVARYRNFYRRLTAKDINTLFEVKRLLQDEGFTQKGAMRKLEGFVPKETLVETLQG